MNLWKTVLINHVTELSNHCVCERVYVRVCACVGVCVVCMCGINSHIYRPEGTETEYRLLLLMIQLMLLLMSCDVMTTVYLKQFLHIPHNKQLALLGGGGGGGGGDEYELVCSLFSMVTCSTLRYWLRTNMNNGNKATHPNNWNMSYSDSTPKHPFENEKGELIWIIQQMACHMIPTSCTTIIRCNSQKRIRYVITDREQQHG